METKLLKNDVLTGPEGGVRWPGGDEFKQGCFVLLNGPL